MSIYEAVKTILLLGWSFVGLIIVIGYFMPMLKMSLLTMGITLSMMGIDVDGIL